MNARPNEGLFEFLDKAGTFILANLMWVVLSIPLVTLPAATAGLFATMSPWTRGKSAEVFRDFFGGMRAHWKTATLIGLVDLLLGVLVFTNFSIFSQMNMSDWLAVLSRSVTVFVAVIGLMVNLYLWPLLVRVEMPIRDLVEIAFKLVFLHPLWSVVLLLLFLAPFAASIFLPGAAFVLATFSTCALLVNWGAGRVLARHFPEDTTT